MKPLKRYRWFILLAVANVILGLIMPEIGARSFAITRQNMVEMLAVIPPIFILLGLLDVWVERETMMKFLGQGSGIKGIGIAFLLGSAAAGPLYAAFPVATVMMKKGASLFNVFIFIGAWATTKIPLITFEMTSLGTAFAGIRLVLNIIGILGIAYLIEKAMTPEEQAEMQGLYQE